jgi:hypothetical protein
MAVLLSDVARVLANVELPEEANAAVQQALTTAETIEDEAYKARGLSKVVQALTQTGQSERTWQILPIVFATARLARRETVFEVLQNVATTLAVINQGQTLWRVYQAVMGVEGWWSSQ